MVAFHKYHSFIDEISKAGHNLQTAIFKCALTNTAPNEANDTVWNSTVAPPPIENAGYTSGGNVLIKTSAVTTAGIFKLVLEDSIFSAAAGQMGPFRYANNYNASAANKLIGFYDYGAAITLIDTDQFTVDLDGANGVLQLQ